ncbi:hypothetical protein ELQ90_03900 [Labedella phragmitis]|uniref:Acyl esterase n=1 Tax=Labedella phragmitis TaxID=2498849 RepID=A0A444PZ13_9MICO|nr:hypothetical protein [Labedella phragmitis]RWZ53077.1 hypothetical protein ELQ90_03900 [Labedella phragmitis]
MTTYSTRSLLQCAAIAAAGGVLIILLGPVGTWVAVASAPLYAVVGSLNLLSPMVALRWTGLPWAATLTAFLAGLLSMSFSVLGLLLIPALVLPALAMDVVAMLVRPRGRALGVYAGAVAGGVVIFAISFVVIPAEIVTPALVVTLLVLRVAAYLGVMRLAGWIAAALERAGVRPSAPRARRPSSDRTRSEGGAA